jgi:hypothetical protein
MQTLAGAQRACSCCCATDLHSVCIGLPGQLLARPFAVCPGVVVTKGLFCCCCFQLRTARAALQFERVLLARSGVLLLAWSDPSGALAALRRSLHGRFPGACSKQSSIIHTSLFRIVEAPAAGAERQQQEQLHGSQQGSSSACCRQLSEAAVAAVSAACERWTGKVRRACSSAVSCVLCSSI